MVTSRWFRGFVSLGLIGGILAWTGPTAIFDAIATARPSLFLLALALTPFVIAVKVWRWHLLARTRAPISFAAATRSYLIGLACATVTPLAAGEVARVAYVPADDRLGLVGVVVLDKVLDLTGVVIIAALSAPWLCLVGLKFVAVAAATGLAVFWIALLALSRRVSGCQSVERGSGDLRGKCIAVAAGLGGTPGGRIVFSLLVCVVGLAVFYGQAFALLCCFHGNAPLEAIAAFPAITLSTILPIGIGGTGVREVAAVALLRSYSVPDAAAFNAFFSHFVIVQVLPSLVGAGMAARGSR